MVLVQGTLPVEYLSDSGPLSAHGIFANAHQILEQYNASTAFTYLLIKNLSITGCEMRMHQVTKMSHLTTAGIVCIRSVCK